MAFLTFRGGIHPYDGKDLSKNCPVEKYLPKGDLAILVSQHIGAPAKPIVKKGDHVLAGQKIAEAGGFVSAPIHSSVSGTVKGIEKRLTAVGAMGDAIIIENDGLYESVEYAPAKLSDLSKEDILKRIDRTVSDYHIEDLMGRSVFSLSGGENKKIACASSSVLLPGIMVLDEPSSNLDMAAIDDLRQVLSLWKKQGKTILIAEHRLYYLHDLADRVLYVKDGEIEREYTPAEFDSLSDSTRKEMGLRPFSLSKLKPANQYQAHTAKLMEFQNFCFAYKKREPESLHIPSAELPVGETIAIIGLNGAGKSTLARCICGLEKKCGLLQVDGKTLDWKARLKHCYMVMQDTSHQLFTESVTDEVLLSIDNEDETVVDKILKQFDLLEYKDRHPLSLSGGQKQRVAIASAIVSNREIIVFDEPTSGLDLKHMREVARSLKSLADQGKTLLVITHDPELVMAGCSYVVHMEKGQIKESYPLDESGSKKVLDFFRIRQ